MSFINSKAQRILLILGIAAAILILIKSIIWTAHPGNSIYNKSFDIPNEIELAFGGYKHNSVIELRSTCNWKSGSDFEQTNDYESKIISRDTQYSINAECLFGNPGPSIIGPERCNNLLNLYFK